MYSTTRPLMPQAATCRQSFAFVAAALASAASAFSDARRVAGTGAGFEDQLRGSVVVSISACHAEDPGSIPAAEFPRKFGFVIAAGGCNTRGGDRTRISP